MTKLSDRVPDFPMTFWLKELARLVEKTDRQLEFVDQRERATAHRQDRLLRQLSEHIDVLMDAERTEAKPDPVGRRLVEEALAICEGCDCWPPPRASIPNIRKLLARAITEWPNVQD